MKFAHFTRSWQGVDFSALRVELKPHSLPSPQFYSAFYEKLNLQVLDVRWLAQKQSTGSWVMQHILDGLDTPRILSVGSGLAIAEQLWMEHSYDVTLHEIQAESVMQARAKY